MIVITIYHLVYLLDRYEGSLYVHTYVYVGTNKYVCTYCYKCWAILAIYVRIYVRYIATYLQV